MDDGISDADVFSTVDVSFVGTSINSGCLSAGVGFAGGTGHEEDVAGNGIILGDEVPTGAPVVGPIGAADGRVS